MTPHTVLVGLPVDEATRSAISAEAGMATPPVRPGSRVFQCRLCGDDLWLGPRQQAALAAAPGTHVLCMPCVRGTIHAIAHLGGD